MSARNPTALEFAAVIYALAVVRGQLSQLKLGVADLSEVERVGQGTSLENIAAVLGEDEADLAVDWNEYLTEAQKRAIQGADDA